MKLMLLLLGWLSVSHGLFADQAGQNDWLKQHIGAFSHTSFHGQYGLVGSPLGAVNLIDMKQGSIEWRVVLAQMPVLDVAFLQTSLFKKSSKRMVSVHSLPTTGFSVNTWNSAGALLWDIELPGEFRAVRYIDNNGAVAVVLADDGVSLVGGKKGKVEWSWKPGGVQWKDLWVNGDGTVSVIGVAADKSLSVASLDISEKKQLSMLNVESVGKLSSDPLHLAVQAGDSVIEAVAFLNENASLAVYDISKMKTSTHKVKADSIHAVSTESGNVLALGNGDTYQLLQVSNGGAAVEKMFKGEHVVHFTSAVDQSVASDAKLAIANLNTFAYTAGGKLLWHIPGEKDSLELKLPKDVLCEEVFVQVSTKKEVSARLVGQFQDGSVTAFHIKTGASSSVTELWTREEALAQVVNKPLAVDIPAANTHDEKNELFQLLGNPNASPAALFVARLKSQVVGFSEGVKDFANGAMRLGSIIVESKGQWLVDAYRGKHGKAGYTDAEKANFGFVKAMLLMTAPGKLFAINSESGEVIWSAFIPGVTGKDTVLHLTRLRTSGTLDPQVLLLTKNGDARYYNALTGELEKEKLAKTSMKIVQTATVPLTLPEMAVIAIDETQQMHVYPQGAVIAPEVLKKTFVYRVTDKKDGIIGYGFSGGKAVELWSLGMAAGHTVLKVQAHEKDAVNSPGRNIGEGSLMIKSINTHLLAVASVAKDNTMTITLLDAVTGKLIERLSHKSCVAPINIVIYENNVIYSAWNSKHKRSDIFAVSIFESTVVGKYELNPWKGMPSWLQSFSSSSFDLEPTKLVVQQKGFFIQDTITTLGVTRSRRGITERDILVGLDRGQVNSIDRRFLDPRRPVGTPSKQEQSEALMGYFPEIPIIPTKTVTYHKTVEQIQTIVTVPSKLESTCLVLVVGLDMFYTRLQPSEGFDLIAEEFNYPLLIMLTSGLFIATTVARKAVIAKKLSAQWK